MNIYFVDNDDHLSEYLTDPELPNECPVCRHKIIPNSLLVSEKELDRQTNIGINEVLFKCANSECNSLFIAEYECFGFGSNIIKTIPASTQKVEVSEKIKNVSSDFYKIYSQATQSEQLGLDSICGVGYRKAIEFLVKDYLKSIETDNYTTEQVENTSLRNCIKQWINNPKIKGVLERATILGNDETHYKKKYLDKDINDLKLLIQLTLHFIEMELAYKEIENSFPI